MASEPDNDAEFEKLMVQLRQEPLIPRFFPEQDTMDKDDSPAPMFMRTDDIPSAEELILTIRNRLGVTGDKWEIQQARAIKKLGSMPWANLGIRTLAMTMFESIAEAQKALATASAMMTADSKNISWEQRNKAGMQMAAVLQSIQKLTAQAIDCLEKGIDPAEAKKAAEAKPRPRNRPPRFNNPTTQVQVNVAPGATASVGLTEGNGDKAINGTIGNA